MSGSRRGRLRRVCAVCGAVLFFWASAWAAEGGFREGAVELRSIGALAFSPEGVLFVADPAGAAVFALDMEGEKSAPGTWKDVPDLHSRVASLLGTEPKLALIQDLALHPLSNWIYLSVSRGSYSTNYLATQVESGAVPVLLRMNTEGRLEEVALARVRHSKASIENPPESSADLWGIPSRTFTITDVAFSEGELLVAGLSNQEFSSRLYRLPFPFRKETEAVPVEVYHTSHGRYETHAPIRTLVPLKVGDEPMVVAAYTCTPLVVFPLSRLQGESKVRGKTVAELGARNTPLDLAAYRRGDADYLLVANNRHPLMRFRLDDVAAAEAMVRPASRGGAAAQSVGVQGVRLLTRAGDDQVLAIQRVDGLDRLIVLPGDL